MPTAQQLFYKYACALAYIAVESRDGSHSIGTAFHVGDGTFVTARHVVEGKRILEVKSTEMIRVPIRQEFPDYPQDAIDKFKEITGSPPTWPIIPEPLEVSAGPFFHSNANIDVAVFQVAKIPAATPIVHLGSHLDDWIPRGEWRLSEAIILGYPPIPHTLEPTLVAARAEINAVVWPRISGKAHFILSATPRGGFSGGLALHRSDFALGVITESLIRDDLPTELGFLAVLSIEPIYECLAEHHLLPECQKGRWEDFWNTNTAAFCEAGGLQVVSISVHDDGKRPYCDIHASDPKLMDRARNAALMAIASAPVEQEIRREDWIRLHIKAGTADHDGKLAMVAGKAAERAIADTGLRHVLQLDKDGAPDGR